MAAWVSLPLADIGTVYVMLPSQTHKAQDTDQPVAGSWDTATWLLDEPYAEPGKGICVPTPSEHGGGGGGGETEC